jgi:hypothetical protein
MAHYRYNNIILPPLDVFTETDQKDLYYLQRSQR